MRTIFFWLLVYGLHLGALVVFATLTCPARSRPLDQVLRLSGLVALSVASFAWARTTAKNAVAAGTTQTVRRLNGPPRFAANCQDCGWKTTAKNAVAAAANHARTRGHCAVVRVERLVAFDARPRGTT